MCMCVCVCACVMNSCLIVHQMRTVSDKEEQLLLQDAASLLVTLNEAYGTPNAVDLNGWSLLHMAYQSSGNIEQ